jgi:hypothetical protein
VRNPAGEDRGSFLRLVLREIRTISMLPRSGGGSEDVRVPLPALPTRALPVPFCLYSFLLDLFTSARVFVDAVPCDRKER